MFGAFGKMKKKKKNSDGFDEEKSPNAERNNEKINTFLTKAYCLAALLCLCSSESMRVLTTIAGKSHKKSHSGLELKPPLFL